MKDESIKFAACAGLILFLIDCGGFILKVTTYWMAFKYLMGTL